MFSQGCVGAGVGCTVAKMGGLGSVLKGGVGSAAFSHSSGLVVGALAAVNCIGDVYGSNGKQIAGPRSSKAGEMSFASDLMAANAFRDRSIIGIDSDGAVSTNTTIAVVATNARLSKAQATRLAIMADDGLSRSVRPAHTPLDGDSVFVLATGSERSPMTLERVSLLGAMAADALSLSIERGVTEATSLGGVPSVRDWVERSADDGIPDS
jgi:L-aminopeptidase/D-esterase-like protein